MQRLLRQNSEKVNSEYGTSLGEEHELGELPEDDEECGGGGDGEDVLPARPLVPGGQGDGQYLGQTDGEGEALPERRGPHHPGALPVVVEEAEAGDEAASHGAGDNKTQEEDERGGGAGGDPDQGDVEVRRILETFTAPDVRQA